MKVLKPLFSLALATVLANAVIPQSFAPLEVSIGLESAEARRSGGRSRGGSFNRSRSSGSSRSRSSGNSRSNTRSSPSSTPRSQTGSSTRGNTGGVTRGGSFNRSTPSPRPSSRPSVAPVPRTTTEPYRRDYRDYDSGYDRRDSGPGTVIVPVPLLIPQNNGFNTPEPVPSPDPIPYTADVEPSPTPSDGDSNGIVPRDTTGGLETLPYTTDNLVVETSNTSNDSGKNKGSGNVLLGLLVLVLVAAGLTYLAWRFLRDRSGASGGELENDIVTVSKLQIGLLASAKTLQAQLTQLSEDADLDSHDGLANFAQECVLSLLRKPEYWVYAGSQSETVKTREEAQQRFESICLDERMKFESETFSRTGDRIVTDDSDAGVPDDELPEYIVVTLVVGSEGDRPLFETVHSAEDLEAALKTIGSMTGDYLSVFTLLWMPQTADGSLTTDELIELYPNIIPIG